MRLKFKKVNFFCDLKAVHFPNHSTRAFGTSAYDMYISMKKRFQGEGKFAGLAALGNSLACKLVVVVDEDVDIYNEQDVLWAVATRVVWDLDVSIIPRVTGLVLEPSAYNDETRLKKGSMTSKVIIDPTKPLDLPSATRISPNRELWNSMDIGDYIK